MPWLWVSFSVSQRCRRSHIPHKCRVSFHLSQFDPKLILTPIARKSIFFDMLCETPPSAPAPQRPSAPAPQRPSAPKLLSEFFATTSAASDRFVSTLDITGSNTATPVSVTTTAGQSHAGSQCPVLRRALCGGGRGRRARRVAERRLVHQLPFHAAQRPDPGHQLHPSSPRRRWFHWLQRLERPRQPHEPVSQK